VGSSPTKVVKTLSSLTTTHSARNLRFIFDEHLTFLTRYHTSVSKSCYYHIRQLRCIRPYLDTKTASTIATSIVHSKLPTRRHIRYEMLFNGPITIAIRARFEYDSTTIRLQHATRCVRFNYDSSAIQHPTRSYVLSSNNEHVNSFPLL